MNKLLLLLMISAVLLLGCENKLKSDRREIFLDCVDAHLTDVSPVAGAYADMVDECNWKAYNMMEGK